MNLSRLDLLMMFIYFAIVFIIGIVSSRRQTGSKQISAMNVEVN